MDYKRELELERGIREASEHENADLREKLNKASLRVIELESDLATIKSQEPLGYFQFDHLWGIHSEVQEQYKDDDGVIPLFARPVAPAQAQIPDGWKLVPVNPWDSMRYAGAESLEESKWETSFAKVLDIYRAMLAAAPTPNEN